MIASSIYLNIACINSFYQLLFVALRFLDHVRNRAPCTRQTGWHRTSCFSATITACRYLYPCISFLCRDKWIDQFAGRRCSTVTQQVRLTRTRYTSGSQIAQWPAAAFKYSVRAALTSCHCTVTLVHAAKCHHYVVSCFILFPAT
jgi:hypothetical protein